MMKKTSKLLVATLAVMIVLMFSVNAFAATLTTASVYNLGTSKVDVSSQITGLTENDEVGYLVKDASANVLYVEQQTVPASGILDFGFTTLPANANANASIKAGSMAGTAITPDPVGTADTIKVDTYTVTATVANGTGGQVSLGTYAQIGSKAVGGQNVLVTITPDQDFEVASICVNGGQDVKTSADQTSYTITNIAADTAVVVTFVAKQTPPTGPILSEPTAPRYDLTSGDYPMCAAYAEFDENGYTVLEYGLLYAPTQTIMDAATDILHTEKYTGATTDLSDGVVRFEAVEGSDTDGKFIVALIDVESALPANYVVTPYVIYEDGEGGDVLLKL